MDGITLRDLEPGDAGWVAMRHGELYWTDEGYGIGFEAVVLDILARFITTRGVHDRAWIAIDSDGLRQGCLFCMQENPMTARLRMFLVEPAWRGTGLAEHLLELAADHSRSRGAERLVVWTHSSHRAAGRLYARTGFRLRGEKPVIAFGQQTTEQNWDFHL